MALQHEAQCPHLQITANAAATFSAVGPQAFGKLALPVWECQGQLKVGTETGPTFWGFPLCPLTHLHPSPWVATGQGTRVRSADSLVQGKEVLWTTPSPVGHTLAGDGSWRFPEYGLMGSL